MAVFGYPTRSVVLDLGAVALDVLIVADLEDYVDAAALLRDTDVPEPPYWAHVWPGTVALARVLVQDADCLGKRVVDLGCGLGVAGLAAAVRGAAVTMVDTAAAALHFVRINAARNGCAVNVLQTDFRHPGMRGRFDYCLAADVTYDPRLQEGLAEFLSCHLAPGGQAWCAESVRTFDVGFRQACEARGLVVVESDMREMAEGRTVPVRLTSVRQSATRAAVANRAPAV